VVLNENNGVFWHVRCNLLLQSEEGKKEMRLPQLICWRVYVEVSRGVLNHIIMSFPPVSDRVFKKAKITKSMNIAAVMCWTYKCSEMFVSIMTRACSLPDADVGQGRNNNERE